MLVTYVSGHGFGHLVRTLEVLRNVRARAPRLPITIVGTAPTSRVQRVLGDGVALRPVPCDVGLSQRDALVIDEAATVERCRAFDASWEERVDAEADFLRSCGARAVLGDIPPLAFAAAARCDLPSVALGNFSWDWIYRHLAQRHSSLRAVAERAAGAYGTASLLLELPFTGDMSAFPQRERVGLVARRPRLERREARRRLALDARTAVLVSFGGIGLPGLAKDHLEGDPDVQFLFPDDVDPRIDALGMEYPDVVGAVDVVITKPGYGIVSDAIAAGTRLVYTERGDFPEYPIMIREMPRWLACAHVSNVDLRAGRLEEAIARVLSEVMPPPPDLDGASRAAMKVLSFLGG